jgi:hypothetical protein
MARVRLSQQALALIVLGCASWFRLVLCSLVGKCVLVAVMLPLPPIAEGNGDDARTAVLVLLNAVIQLGHFSH